MFKLLQVTFLEYSDEHIVSYAMSQAELNNWSTSLMVVGTAAGFTPAGTMMFRRGGDDGVIMGDKDVHLKL